VGQCAEEGLGQFAARLAIGAGVGGAGGQRQADAQHHEARHSGDARLGAAEDLSEKTPERECGGEDVVASAGKADTQIVGDALD